MARLLAVTRGDGVTCAQYSCALITQYTSLCSNTLRAARCCTMCVCVSCVCVCACARVGARALHLSCSQLICMRLCGVPGNADSRGEGEITRRPRLGRCCRFSRFLSLARLRARVRSLSWSRKRPWGWTEMRRTGCESRKANVRETMCVREREREREKERESCGLTSG
jgi:hypothetical protein